MENCLFNYLFLGGGLGDGAGETGLGDGGTLGARLSGGTLGAFSTGVRLFWCIKLPLLS